MYSEIYMYELCMLIYVFKIMSIIYIYIVYIYYIYYIYTIYCICTLVMVLFFNSIAASASPPVIRSGITVLLTSIFPIRLRDRERYVIDVFNVIASQRLPHSIVN